MPDTALWRLERFLLEFDAWIEREHPSDDLRVLVTEWMVGRQDDPYRGVRREPQWIVESQHLIRCNSFATLSLPL